MRCVFSGCNGEVLQMRLLPNGILSLLTVTKVGIFLCILCFYFYIFRFCLYRLAMAVQYFWLCLWGCSWNALLFYVTGKE